MANKMIKLTSSYDNSEIYINVLYIGHFYKDENNTRVGVSTHNNGGFKVKETSEEILKLITKNK